MGLGWLSKPFKWADRQLFGSGPPNTYGRQIDAAGEHAHTMGDEAESEYASRSRDFDPQASLERSASGLFDQFEQSTGRKIEKLRGSEVGAGRLGGGYGAEDETAAIYDSRADLNSRIASMSLDSERLKLDNLRDIGAFGESQQNRYLDVLSGQRDSETARHNARTQQRSGFWSALAELGGKAVGSKMGGGNGPGSPYA